jgi:hypothetical protein
MSLSQFPVRAVAVSTWSLIGVSNVGASQVIDAHRERDVSNGALFLARATGTRRIPADLLLRTLMQRANSAA